MTRSKRSSPGRTLKVSGPGRAFRTGRPRRCSYCVGECLTVEEQAAGGVCGDCYDQIKKRYHHARWARLRAMVLADSPICQQCLEADKIEPAVDVDHIERWTLRPDLFWVPENLRPLCKRCHSEKTYSETLGKSRS